MVKTSGKNENQLWGIGIAFLFYFYFLKIILFKYAILFQ